MIITALNYNKFYYDQLKVLLNSLRKNSPQDKILVHLVDFPENEKKNLKLMYENFEFVIPKFSVKNEKDIAGKMVCYRSIIIKDSLEKLKEPIAWFDTDVIVRKPLKEFWGDVKNNVFKIMVRTDSPPKSKFQAGIFAVGYSEETKKFINEWNDTVQKNVKWYEDQLQLFMVYEKYKNNIALIPLDKKFNDVGDSNNKNSFDEDSVIWHCKKSHFHNPKFSKEFNYYSKN